MRLQIDLRLRHLLLRGFEGGLRLDRGAGEGLLFLRGGARSESRCRRSDCTCLTCRSAAFCRDWALSSLQRHFEVEWIDHVEHVALVNILIVADLEFRDLA